ncbi:C40 family peptidase [Streptomyces sp. NPDC056653]|uniref:C40 family peptidase n=1 Tax=Streptomyces sp. NPDC056653 TaxID=3345894 RepID=UPI0036AF5271
MPKSAGISGAGIAMATAGGYLMYCGIKDVALAQGLRDLTSGTLPQGAAATSGGAVERAAFRLAGGGGAAAGGGTAGAVQAGAVSGGPHPELARAALAYLGVRYVWGGTTPNGLDCSGLVQLAFHDIGVSAPRSTYTQEPWTQLQTISAGQAGAGDLVFWPGHVAIVTAPGTVVHAPHPGTVVRTEQVGRAGPVGMSPTYKRYIGAAKPRTAAA